MKLSLTLLLGLLAPSAALAQTTPLPALAPVPADTSYWRTSLKAGVNLNEAVVSDNWKGGGATSLGLSTLFNGQAHYLRGPRSWDNEADFLYAGQYTRGQGYRKTNDRLWLDTKYGHALTPKWDAFVSLNMLSQFAPGYDYSGEVPRLVSSFLAPAYLTNAYGFEFHPSKRFSLRLSPFAPRLTIVREMSRFQTLPTDQVYGVAPNHTTRWEILAAQVLASLDQPLGPNANFKARYLLFTNYGAFRLREINHRLDLTLTAKVYGLLSVNFQSTVLYQYDQDSNIQFSQGLGLGLLLTRQRPAVVAK
ncbi:hypothetical protein GCM10023172_30020 [Hymenobacter ginsengisoli]|uniref:DUF3078 domain-containing protein n=1 Tax=Hymenobacter ginsengisoli TaxID=1051626 RepID=A0ABP8QIT5_9BACT|nr:MULTISPECIES: DUF3078 domain-containing protein [unclassified Hymenobacter]MBO2033384.1 DUF3078 domain-containing protein [Hymenobacter sp. BT559]